MKKSSFTQRTAYKEMTCSYSNITYNIYKSEIGPDIISSSLDSSFYLASTIFIATRYPYLYLAGQDQRNGINEIPIC